MNTNDFVKQVTSTQIKENINKMFGLKVNLESYSREQLEDMRNKLRTRIFQHEGKLGVNDLLTNETYQKDKAMLDLLNTRIKEMLGEDIKKLRDKLQQLDEAKKGVKAPKYTKKAKGTDQTGDGKSNFDDVQVARMTAGGVPKKKAIAKATSDKFEENRVVKGKRYGADYDGSTHDDSKTKPKGSSEKTAADRARDTAMDKAEEKAGKDWEARGYKRTVVKGKSQSGSKEVDEAVEKCNHTAEGKMCEVHGKKACPKVESVVAEKAVSKAQQKFMGMVHAAKKGEKPASKEVAKAAKGMSGKEAEKFASTKHKGLPEKKKKADESTQIYRRNVRIVNESLGYLLAEDEEEKANTITAAGDMANDFTSWMQRVGQYQTKVMIELADEIRHNFGAQQAEAFKQAVGPALSATLETLTTQREAISNAIAGLAGGEVPPAPMGAEPGGEMAPPAEAPMEPAGPDEMNTPPADEFAAADAATAGREMRESKFSRKLAESHSIISKLAR